MTTDHRRLPRKKRPISPRDQAIYIAYHSQGFTQTQLAKRFHLSQRRIAAILHRISTIPNSRPGTSSLPVEVARAAAQAIFTRALRSYENGPTETTTTQTGRRGKNDFHVTTCRQLPPNHQLLKAAIKASAELARLAKLPPAGPPAFRSLPSSTSKYSKCSNPSTDSNQPPGLQVIVSE